MPSLRIGLQAAIVYIAVVASGMYYIHHIQTLPFGTSLMVTHFWWVQLILCALTLLYATRYFGLRAVGFGPVNWRAMVWMLPAYVVIAAMVLTLLPDMLAGSLTDAEWAVLVGLTLTTFLIGFSEEVMFRGVLLRGALTRLPALRAMLLSAVLFASLHLVNMIAGQSFGNTIQQTAFAFLVGFALAPLALKIGNLWPLIIWHWLWDLLLFSSDMLGVLQPFALLGLLFQVVISLLLWGEVMRD